MEFFKPVFTDLVAQWVMAVGTLGIVFLTFLGFYYIRKTYHETKKAVLATRETVTVSQEAVTKSTRIGNEQIKISQTTQAGFLSIKSVRLKPYDDKGQRSIIVEYENIGPSVCVNIRYSITHKIHSEYGKIVTQPNDIPEINPNNKNLPPRRPTSECMTYRSDQSLVELGNQAYLCVSGVLLWKDIFNVWRGVRFSYGKKYHEIEGDAVLKTDIHGNGILKEYQIADLLSEDYVPKPVNIEM